MFHIDNDLYRISPAYRQLADELRRLEGENGALSAAYGNALNDQKRVKADLAHLIQSIDTQLRQFQVLHRDDPGRGGSGGAG